MVRNRILVVEDDESISVEWHNHSFVDHTICGCRTSCKRLLTFYEIENALVFMLLVIYGRVAEFLDGLALHIGRTRQGLARVETTQANGKILTARWCFYGKGIPVPRWMAANSAVCRVKLFEILRFILLFGPFYGLF